MAAINDLIAQIEDEGLRQRIEAELTRLLKQKKFGLVFEEHQPEGLCEGPIYPTLEVLDKVQHAPDKALWHALIEADNYYALQLLAYLYPGMVDCIYIDPPYNTGARDWKYNNDYVDSADQYRHSKWLSMMKRRLLLAKKLLNPRDSVLIVTIDEKEYLHLGCLLEELFPEARMQMVSSVISRKGSMRKSEFSRCVEYIFFVMIGEASPCDSDHDMSGTGKESHSESPVLWQYLKRRGTSVGASRKGRPGLFYPIFIKRSDNTFHSVGESLPLNQDRHSIIPPNGTWAAWPLRPNGEEGVWQVQQSRFLEQLEEGTCYLSRVDETSESAQFLYLKDADRKKVLNGDVDILGRDEFGKLIVEQSSGKKRVRPKDVWVVESHDATHGSNLLNKILVDKRFNYPKSLYSTHDTIRFFVANKPNALIVDFFAGSGTTLHAVNLLNAEDGGNRRCIMVTNNEVSEQEAKALTKQGFKPGDDAWERLGIARYVTWPRTVCSIEGHDVKGEPLKGEYLGTDHRQMKDGFAANCAFFKLNFLDKTQVALGRQFRELLPLLWMKAGAEGSCPEMPENPENPDNPERPERPDNPDIPENPEIPAMLLFPENGFAVLVDEKAFGRFVESVNACDGIRMVYLVVDSDAMYREMASCFPGRQTCQLYRDYLDNFRINITR